MTDETKLVDQLSHYFPQEFRGVYPSPPFKERSLQDLHWAPNSSNIIIFKTNRDSDERFSALLQKTDGQTEYFDPWGKNPQWEVTNWLCDHIPNWTIINDKYLLPRDSRDSAAFCAYYVINRAGSHDYFSIMMEFGDNLKRNSTIVRHHMPLFDSENLYIA